MIYIACSIGDNVILCRNRYLSHVASLNWLTVANYTRITSAQKSCLAEEVEYSEYEKLFHKRFGDSIIFCFTDRKAQIHLDLISLVKRQKCETKTMFVLRKNGLFYINFCRCIIVFRHFSSIFNKISKICKIYGLIQSCTLNTLLESKSSSLFNIKNEYFKMREVAIPQQ